MIRQFGHPTWFCSFSAAVTLAENIRKNSRKKQLYFDAEIAAMSWQKKSELIQGDPVTCARCFQNMVNRFIADFLKSGLTPIGEIMDFSYRFEFQQRDSPHIHALFWIKNAPKYGEHENDKILHLVDKHVTCSSKTQNNSDEVLINLKTHRHAKTCKKKGHKICRLNFPLPPVRNSVILHPIDHDLLEKEDAKALKQNF